MGHLECEHVKRLLTITSDNIKRISLKKEIKRAPQMSKKVKYSFKYVQ